MDNPLEQARAYYLDCLNRHGFCAEGVGWGSAETQRKRFEAMNLWSLWPWGSLLDVGCGLGDLVLFLKEKGQDCRDTYIGIDAMPEMVEEARHRHAGWRFEVCPLEKWERKADVVMASGIFTTSPDGVYAQNLICWLWALTNRVLMFNCLLKTHHSPKGANEFSTIAANTAQFCSFFSKNVRVRLDYHPRDFTVFMRRG